jgi:hypothetical protein
MFTGCGTKVSKENAGNQVSEKNYGSGINQEVQDLLDNEASEEALSDKIGTGEVTEKAKTPEPASNYGVQWECGTYYSDISYPNLQAYLKKLQEDGWNDFYGKEVSQEIESGVSELMLVRDQELLQALVFLNNKEESMNNSILVRKDSSLDIDNIRTRVNTLTKEEAAVKISQYAENAVSSGEIPYPLKPLTGVFEIFIEGAYDKLEMQAYAAVSDTGYYGCYLIRRGVVSYVGGDLSKACIADIDKDGKFELMDLYSAWDSGITKYNLMAYEYINPIYFNSLTEILQVKYSNCFVPKGEYEDLSFEKIDGTTVRLYSSNKDYGNILIEGIALKLNNMEEFPFDQWSTYYDQDILKNMEKTIPTAPPEIGISIDGTDIGYAVKETNWNGTEAEYTVEDAYKEIMNQGRFIPTFKLSNMIEVEVTRPVVIDFGSSIPDSVLIYDAMLDSDGSIRYNENLIQKQIFKIVDNSHIQFDLTQHMTYYLSSNTGDYQRDWYRLFRLVCTWGDKECTYAFLINTGNTEKLSE